MPDTLAERLALVQQRIADACARAGRTPDEVQLVTVSKTHGPDRIEEAVSCGLTVFGESRIQEARAKIPLCPGHLQWHLIGHLQTNKVKQAAPLFDVVHSVDSERLLEAYNAACTEAGRTTRIFLQVNVSGEGSKFGIAPDQLPALLERSCSCMNLEVVGLMTIPPFAEEAEKARPHFARLRALRDETAARCGVPLPELSMGMSHDFEIAIEEGATVIRIGTAIMGERK